jgi:ubiquinone/menaquinone biosynthesis C-methylase UbiE
MKREKIKEFWTNRAKVSGVPRIESVVNLEPDKELVELKIKQEITCIESHMPLYKTDILVDLGSGIGQWSLRFAHQVKQVYAVEFVDDFTKIARKRAFEQNISNIEFVQCVVEDYMANCSANQLFISGLLHYLDDEQYEKTLDNASKYIGSGGRVFLREAVSLLGKEYELEDQFSEAAQANYSALYRTADQHIKAFSKRGFQLQEHGTFFEDGSPLNKFSETRLYYFCFIKP